MNAFPVGWGVGNPDQIFGSLSDPPTSPMKGLAPLGYESKPFPWFAWNWQHWDNPLYPNYHPCIYGARLDYSRAEDDGSHTTMADAIRGSEKAWVFLNEPNMHSQANLSPSQACDVLAKALAINPSFRWFGPNVCLKGDDYGRGWLTEFRNLLRVRSLPLPEAWGVHFYNLRLPIETGFDDKLEWFNKWMVINGCVRPIIITEVSAENHPIDIQIDLLRHIQKRMGSDHLQSAWWFATNYDRWRENEPYNLVDVNGAPTRLGDVFRSL